MPQLMLGKGGGGGEVKLLPSSPEDTVLMTVGMSCHRCCCCISVQGNKVSVCVKLAVHVHHLLLFSAQITHNRLIKHPLNQFNLREVLPSAIGVS